MSVQVVTQNSTEQLYLSGMAISKDQETIKQDAGRSSALAFATVMGKIINTVATTGTADGGNTGDGTVTAVAKLADGKSLITGGYVLTCTAAVTNGGVFKLEDPNGNLVADGLVMTVGAGAATIFNAGGMTFTITDGATDFAADDFFTITVTADGDYTPLVLDNVNGGSEVAGIFIGADIVAASLVAGDVVDQPILVGGDALVIDESLVVVEGIATLDSILPSGKSVRDELASLGIFVGETISITSGQS